MRNNASSIGFSDNVRCWWRKHKTCEQQRKKFIPLMSWRRAAVLGVHVDRKIVGCWLKRRKNRIKFHFKCFSSSTMLCSAEQIISLSDSSFHLVQTEWCKSMACRKYDYNEIYRVWSPIHSIFELGKPTKNSSETFSPCQRLLLSSSRIDCSKHFNCFVSSVKYFSSEYRVFLTQWRSQYLLNNGKQAKLPLEQQQESREN